jgi:hypothetical protein
MVQVRKEAKYRTRSEVHSTHLEAVTKYKSVPSHAPSRLQGRGSHRELEDLQKFALAVVVLWPICIEVDKDMIFKLQLLEAFWHTKRSLKSSSLLCNRWR